jgi:hypothetical protein
MLNAMLGVMEPSLPQQRILMSMGAMLVLLQATEKVINLCLTFVFQKHTRLTIEALAQQQNEERKKTIGYFLNELRKRTELDSSFDDLLREFLDARNTFIHKLDEIEGWSLGSVPGLKVAEKFLSKLATLNKKVLFTFSGFLRAWQDQVKLQVPIPAGSEDLFQHIDRYYTPLIDHLVFKKHA